MGKAWSIVDPSGQEVPWDEELESDIAEEVPAYMHGRAQHDEELEARFDAPFEEFRIFRARRRRDDETLAGASELVRQSVGVLKASVHVPPPESASQPEPQQDLEIKEIDMDLEAVRKGVQHCRLRLYVLGAQGIAAKDDNNKSDPYLVVTLGEQRQSLQDHPVFETTDPGFFEMMECNCTLPGASALKVELWDYDQFSADELIGGTTIDLEQRWYSSTWKQLAGAKHGFDGLLPVERRKLWNPRSKAEQGTVKLWLELLPTSGPTRITLPRALDIKPPPKQEFEVRIVFWKTEGVCKKTVDGFSRPPDLYIKAGLGQDRDDSQTTDTHLRCEDGNGSFNWRMKFPVLLPLEGGEGEGYLTMQALDFNVLEDEVIAEATVDLTRKLQLALRLAKSSTAAAPADAHAATGDVEDPPPQPKTLPPPGTSFKVFGPDRMMPPSRRSRLIEDASRAKAAWRSPQAEEAAHSPESIAARAKSRSKNAIRVPLRPTPPSSPRTCALARRMHRPANPAPLAPGGGRLGDGQQAPQGGL